MNKSSKIEDRYSPMHILDTTIGHVSMNSDSLAHMSYLEYVIFIGNNFHDSQ